MTSEEAIRSQQIIIEQPLLPDAEVGVCKWCGQSIEIVDGAHHSSYKRTYHRGDELEIGDTVNCRQQYQSSWCWSARDALKYIARRDHNRQMICVDCGTLCQVIGRTNNADSIDYFDWEADHDTPLWAGGAHSIENFRVRCSGCHGVKTVREAAERANQKRSA